MTDYLADFLDFMTKNGLSPASSLDILCDDRPHYFQVSGDKPSEKRGSYCLRVEDDFACGWLYSHRYGETYNYTSKSAKAPTPEQKAAFKAKSEAAKQRREQEQAVAWDRAAVEAKILWNSATPVTEHPYLAKKQIQSHGVRIHNDKLLIPLYADNKLWSLQTIDSEGNKLYAWYNDDGELISGRKKGCYLPLTTKDEDKSTIVICEGFSTAASIREATDLPVVCAFDSGNLKPVALSMREKYPDSKFVIAADNDRFTKDQKGKLLNVGILKAQEAAGIIGAGCIWPEFPETDISSSDFNDIAVLYEKEYLQNRIVQAIPKIAPILEPDDNGGDGAGSLDSSVQAIPTTPLKPRDINEDNWGEFLIVGDKGVKNSSLQNMILFLRFHKNFKGVFAYNEFHHNIVMVKCPMWGDPAHFEVDRISDIIVSQTTAELEKLGQAPDINRTYKAIQVAAQYNKFHPAREYFNNLKWDGKPRLKTWLKVYLGCESESDKYLEFVGRKWLTAGVTRIFHPGKKFDHVLVIEGEQGAYKSTSLKKLATFGADKPIEYFTDSVTIADIQNKDTIMKIQGSIIVELSELSGFSKKDDEEIKRWITLEHDNIRLPYGRETSMFKRQFILAATTNKYDYLKDPTGNRRYWPVRAGTKINIEGIERDKEQLWAEAVSEYKSGLYLGATYEEEAWANEERHKRLAQDAWTELVLEKAHDKLNNKFKVADLMADMGMALRDKDDRSMRRISSILQIHGYENRSKWNSETHKAERFWVRKDVAVQKEMNYDNDEEVPFS